MPPQRSRKSQIKDTRRKKAFGATSLDVRCLHSGTEHFKGNARNIRISFLRHFPEQNAQISPGTLFVPEGRAQFSEKERRRGEEFDVKSLPWPLFHTKCENGIGRAICPQRACTNPGKREGGRDKEPDLSSLNVQSSRFLMGHLKGDVRRFPPWPFFTRCANSFFCYFYAKKRKLNYNSFLFARTRIARIVGLMLSFIW